MLYQDYQRIILATVLSAARMGAAFMILPALSDSMIPGLVRRAVVVAFSLLAVPHVLAGMPPGEPEWGVLAAVGAKEVLVGLLLGFFGAAPFWIAENVGNFIDNQRGATMGEVFSPLSGSQDSTIGLFFSQIVSTVFFVSGAVFLFLGAIYSSYSIWPVFTGVEFTPGAATGMLGAVDSLLKTTVVIASPVIILMFMATVGLGFVNRTAPQLNVFFLSMPVKSALGVAMLVAYLPFIMDKLMYTDANAILHPVMRLVGRGAL